MTVEIVGPFKTHKVIVNGYEVPFLHAHPMKGGKVQLILDDRFGVDIPVADLDWLVKFIANCIAVAGGYTCHPDTESDTEANHGPRRRTGYSRMRGIGYPQ